MDPVTMLAIAGVTSQVMGAITAGNTADQIGTANAVALDQQAANAQQVAGGRELLVRERNRQALASQRAAQSSSGVDPTSGSALIGAEQQMRDAELDALTTRYEGILQAKGLHDQAVQELYQGKVAKAKAQVSAVGSLIGGAGNYLSASGFGKFGPGFSGQQAPAPVSISVPRANPYYKG